MELRVNKLKGFNNVVFGMSPDYVTESLGKAESTSTAIGMEDDSVVRRTEIREKVKFIYEKEELVCICGDLGVPFFLGEDRIPSTFFEALRMLKDKSKLNIRFSKSTSYVFADLGIVIYPSTTIDIEAGNHTTTSKHKVAICNMEVLSRYSQYFMKNDGKENDDLKTFLLGKLGEFAETYDQLDE